MKILVFNWRDCKHPKAGGAEVFTEEIIRRWASWGHDVTLFTSSFDKALSEESVQGVHVIRRGGEKTLYLHAFNYYRKEAKDQFDLIIDEINAIPFLTPLYTSQDKRARTFFWIHHICRRQWFYEAKFPVNIAGYFLEPLSLMFYRNKPGMALSTSTQNELIRLGHKKSNLNIMPKGISFAPLSQLDWSYKNPDPTFIYVGRVISHKRIHHIIRAFAEIYRKWPKARLQIVGTGGPDYLAHLHDLCNQLGISDVVEFCGFVSQEVKLDLMRRAHALMVASLGEGWGLVVTEANAMGTPAIVYDVKGLRDSVNNNHTGLITQENTPKGLADAIAYFLTNPALQQRLAYNAWEWSQEFSWDLAAKNILQQLSKTYVLTEPVASDIINSNVEVIIAYDKARMIN